MIEEIKTLRSKVEAGDAKLRDFDEVFSSPCQDMTFTEIPTNAYYAFRGSLDAAKNLHNVVLKDWETVLWQESDLRHEVHDGKWRCRVVWLHRSAHKGPNRFGREAEGQDNEPARAWLLAILDAMLVTEEKETDNR